MKHELTQMLDFSGAELYSLADRIRAVDARESSGEAEIDAEVDPFYTLRDQLFVEPQPLTHPSKFELDSPIQMSQPEVAVARSHINIWKQVAASDHDYVLVLEDDVWFRFGFARRLDRAWRQLQEGCNERGKFDILYLAYQEAKYGAPKVVLSDDVFRPERGLWELAGYIISRQGAEKLIRLLPCRGPVDLWLNGQFSNLCVCAIRRPIISQRRDGSSTNLYSVLPALTKIGAISGENASLFHIRPSRRPVFAFGRQGSGLSSLAMALSMLGYRCCSDLETMPRQELDSLLSGREDRIFDAYVNIGSLDSHIGSLRKHFPHAKFILTSDDHIDPQLCSVDDVSGLEGADLAHLPLRAPAKWKLLCEHLECAPPTSAFPDLVDLGQRQLLSAEIRIDAAIEAAVPKRDKSPWVVEKRTSWRGIHACTSDQRSHARARPIKFNDCLHAIDERRWFPRDDTFAGNLALFRPANIECSARFGWTLQVKRESLGVREYSAAAVSSHDRYLYGRFEASIKASNVPGIVTGFFLHRDSPRQEIDVEIAGNRPDRLLVNVFYNPGADGARYDYGYRGAASCIELGFDASKRFHCYAIEWTPSEIRWFVDDRLVHQRVEWDPTPIPHLPMVVHVNAWPSMSRELAGRLANRMLPATSCVRSIKLDAGLVQPRESHENYLLQAGS